MDIYVFMKMENKEISEQRTEKLGDHIDDNLDASAKRNVRNKYSFLQKKVEDFYDLKKWVGVATCVPIEGYCFKTKNDERKIGKTPKSLINLLNGKLINKEKIDVTKLKYEDVKNDYDELYQRYQSSSFLGTVIMFGGIFLGLTTAGIIRSYGGIAEYPVLSGALALGAIPSVLLANKLAEKFYPKPSGSNGEWDELKKLHRCAQEYDGKFNPSMERFFDEDEFSWSWGDN